MVGLAVVLPVVLLALVLPSCHRLACLVGCLVAWLLGCLIVWLLAGDAAMPQAGMRM